MVVDVAPARRSAACDVVPAERGRRFRADIEGLRAVAVVLVVAFHAGAGAVPGGFVGVDVFFVLSGFLITGLLVDELRATGSVSLRGFYARRVRRLLPAATLVLVVTAAASALLLPPLDRPEVARDVQAAALFVANWEFAAESTQYMADTEKSPVLHFWSLSVEEQFYVVWPLLLLLAVGRNGLALRAWRVALRRMVLALAVLGGASFALSVLLTPGSGPFAYFGLHTRAWELAAGAGLALARPALSRLTRTRLAGPVAALAGWGGLLLVLWAALRLDSATPFPGTAAVLPVAGAALLVAAGSAPRLTGATRLLSHPTLGYVGRVSYGWYLWHWPCLVLAKARFGTPDPDALAEAGDGSAPAAVVLAAVVLSFGLAVATRALLEDPVRHSPWLSAARRRSLALGAALVAAAALAAPPVLAQEESPGSTVDLLASAARARAAPPRGAPGGGGGGAEAAGRAGGVFGNPRGKRVVALIGDSHATQFLPAVDRVAKARGWKLHLWAKSSCPVADVPVWLPRFKARYDACADWRAALMRRLEGLPRLDAVLLGRISGYTSLVLTPEGARTTPETVEAPWRAAMRRTVAELSKATDRVVVLRDTPHPGKDAPACVSGAPRDPRACDFARAKGVDLDAPLARAEEAVPGIRFADVAAAMCPGDPCPVVARDGSLLYRDRNHITATASERLWRPLGRALDAALDDRDRSS